MEYFTEKEIKDVEEALSDISKVGIQVGSHGDYLSQRRTFFDKAHLWQVVKRIIAVLYIQKLINGELSLIDTEGNEYIVELKPIMEVKDETSR
jgi:hypothetical protein